MAVPSHPLPPLLSLFASAAGNDPQWQTELRAFFAHYYIQGHWYAYPGRGHQLLSVDFEGSDFDHICFKEPNPTTTARTQWRTDRAERLLWVGFTLENPDQTRWLRPSNRYVLARNTGDTALPVYVVVLDLIHQDHFDFITAYPGDGKKQRSLRLEGVPVRVQP